MGYFGLLFTSIFLLIISCAIGKIIEDKIGGYVASCIMGPVISFFGLSTLALIAFAFIELSL